MVRRIDDDLPNGKKAKKESVGRRRLTEKRWGLSIPDSISGPMREAIAMEEYMDVATALKACWEFIHNSIPDQYDEFDFASDCAQIDDIIEQLEEDEWADVEDDLNYLLEEFYDFCDNMNIWIGGL